MNLSQLDTRIKIFVGNYGSGKTELAMDCARNHAGEMTLVDLDIVNPYFRSNEKTPELNEKGVTVIAPGFAGTALDAPVLTAQVQSVFYNTKSHVVFDVGGDPTGATALGRYHANFLAEPPVVLFVINACRPFSSHVSDVLDLIDGIELRSRLKVDYLINNTNLAAQTTAQVLMDGQTLVNQVSQASGIPIIAVTGTQQVIDQLPASFKAQYGPLLHAFTPVMRPDWIDR